MTYNRFEALVGQVETLAALVAFDHRDQCPQKQLDDHLDRLDEVKHELLAWAGSRELK